MTRLGIRGRRPGSGWKNSAPLTTPFLDAGASVTVASPKGGEPPLDPKSDTPDGQTNLTRRFKNDPKSQAVLASTIKLSDVKARDLAEDPISNTLIESFYNAGKPLACSRTTSSASRRYDLIHVIERQ
jgi:hypothetical protein